MSTPSTSSNTNFSKIERKKNTSAKFLVDANQTATGSKFPRIEDCVHFHYESVGYGDIKLCFVDDSSDNFKLNGSISLEGLKPIFSVRITCKSNSWVVKRSLSHFELLDTWLHECVYDRKFSQLCQLSSASLETRTLDDIQHILREYLTQLSTICEAGDELGGQIFCAPVLHWFELDSHGRNIVAHALGDVADINIPAVAAARVVRRYTSTDDDELSLEVGDMVSIIEMGASGWWRGKQGLKVGSFPAPCVRRINSSSDVEGTHQRPFSPPAPPVHIKPIARKHGKFMDFLRSFLDNRPSKAHLKRKGILKERVFGCDLGELLHRTQEEVPTVITDCTRFVEQHGIVDGIYRISGVASHIRHLRYEFDCDRRPDLEKDMVDIPKTGHVPGMSKDGNMICDPHSIAGLCKLFFRDLPNPLLTYQLYNRFASSVTEYDAEERLLKVHDVIQQLPPPHYRTLKHLIGHLRFMSQHDSKTSMHCRNLAIVWAPNLLRSRELEAGLAAFTEVRVQSVVTEFLIVNGDILFSDKLQTMQYDADHKPPRPRSLMILPTPKLISLEEAQARSRGGLPAPTSDSLNSSTETGVRLRESGDKQSSADRRKRHTKKTNQAFIHSSTPKVLRKHGSSQANLHQSDQSTTDSHTTGWKVKLGSLLRKSNAHSSMLSQSSLRRTQSDDSLVSSGSQQKISETATRGKKTLSHASSCEEGGFCDRLFPEPQVPHPNVPTSNPSPVPMRNRPADNRPHPNNPRPTGVYSDEPTDTKNIFELKYKPVKLRQPRDPSPHIDTNIRSSSPFSGLASDFPGVMGEGGLGFDPLNYRPMNINSPLDPQKTITPTTKSPENVKQWSSSEDTSPVGLGGRTISIKRVASVQSLHGEPMFAAVSTITPPHGWGSPHNTLDDNKLVSLPEISADSADSKNSHSSSTEQRKIMSPVVQRMPLDGLTAECFDISPSKPTQPVARKASAAQLLGIAPYNPMDHVPTNKSVEAVNLHLDLNENIKPADVPNTSERKLANETKCVQYYPAEGGLTKKEHYGSLIALVGLKSDPKPPSESHQPKYNHTRHESINEHGRQYSKNVKPRTKSSSVYKFSPPRYEYLKEDPVFRSPNTMTYVEASSTRVYTARLDSFNPEGRQRDDYGGYTPPKPTTHHSRSQSVDSYPCNGAKLNLTSQYKDTPGASPNLPIVQSNPTSLPLPAPRMHYRSYSAGDDLQSQPKPTPKPRSRASLESRFSHPLNHPHISSAPVTPREYPGSDTGLPREYPNFNPRIPRDRVYSELKSSPEYPVDYRTPRDFNAPKKLPTTSRAVQGYLSGQNTPEDKISSCNQRDYNSDCRVAHVLGNQPHHQSSYTNNTYEDWYSNPRTPNYNRYSDPSENYMKHRNTGPSRLTFRQSDLEVQDFHTNHGELYKTNSYPQKQYRASYAEGVSYTNATYTAYPSKEYMEQDLYHNNQPVKHTVAHVTTPQQAAGLSWV